MGSDVLPRHHISETSNRRPVLRNSSFAGENVTLTNCAGTEVIAQSIRRRQLSSASSSTAVKRDPDAQLDPAALPRMSVIDARPLRDALSAHHQPRGRQKEVGGPEGPPHSRCKTSAS